MVNLIKRSQNKELRSQPRLLRWALLLALSVLAGNYAAFAAAVVAPPPSNAIPPTGIAKVRTRNGAKTEQETVSKPVPSIHPLSFNELRRLELLRSAAQKMKMGEGTAFVAFDKAAVIQTRMADILVAPKAVAYVIQLGESVSVYNLTDYENGDISATLPNGEVIAVTIDHELLINGNLLANFDETNPAPSVESQDPISAGRHSGFNLFDAHFTITSLLDQAPEFAQLSKDKPADREIAERIFKTVAIFESAS